MCTVTVERCSVEIRGTWDTNIGDKYASQSYMRQKMTMSSVALQAKL